METHVVFLSELCLLNNKKNVVLQYDAAACYSFVQNVLAQSHFVIQISIGIVFKVSSFINHVRNTRKNT
jgi:hypothetical protein